MDIKNLEPFYYNNYFIFILRYIFSYFFSQKTYFKNMYDFKVQMGFSDFEQESKNPDYFNTVVTKFKLFSKRLKR